MTEVTTNNMSSSELHEDDVDLAAELMEEFLSMFDPKTVARVSKDIEKISRGVTNSIGMVADNIDVEALKEFGEEVAQGTKEIWEETVAVEMEIVKEQATHSYRYFMKYKDQKMKDSKKQLDASMKSTLVAVEEYFKNLSGMAKDVFNKPKQIDYETRQDEGRRARRRRIPKEPELPVIGVRDNVETPMEPELRDESEKDAPALPVIGVQEKIKPTPVKRVRRKVKKDACELLEIGSVKESKKDTSVIDPPPAGDGDVTEVRSCDKNDSNRKDTKGESASETKGTKGETPSETKDTTGETSPETKDTTGETPSETKVTTGETPPETRDTTGETSPETKDTTGETSSETKVTTGETPSETKDTTGETPPETEDNTSEEKNNVDETDEQPRIVVDYEKNKTKLYSLIEKQDWDGVMDRLVTNPEEASHWICRRQKADATKLMWMMLPIHAVCYPKTTKDSDGKIIRCGIRGKICVVEKLLELYPDGAKMVDDVKNTPLHLACRNGASSVVLTCLLDRAPHALYMKDHKDRDPLQVVENSETTLNKQRIVHILKERKRRELNFKYWKTIQEHDED